MSALPLHELIHRLPMFSALSEAACRELAGSAVVRRVRRGEMLVRQGAQTEEVFILLNGGARVFVANSRGREIVLAQLGQGDIVGEMSLIDQQPHAATVRVEATADVLVLERTAVLNLLPLPLSAAHTLLRNLVGRLRRADRQIESLALLDVQERVSRELVARAEQVDDQFVIRGRVSRQELAQCIGATREMVSRVMSELEAGGKIHTRDDGALVVSAALR